MGLAQVKRAYMARNGGCVARNTPRISNLDKGIEIIGYTEVNIQATSILGRVKIHKGYFYCDEGSVADGDLILDRADDSRYLVMSSKGQRHGYEVIYYDATLLHCASQVTVSRFGDGLRDSFGRVVSDQPSVIASGVWVMINPQNFTEVQQQDRPVAQDKISIYLQHSVGAQQADRITSGSGRNYIVESVNEESLKESGIDILYVDLDVR